MKELRSRKRLHIGQIFRYARPYKPEPVSIDGLPNYFAATYTAGLKLPLLERGINPIEKVDGPDGPRCPAILISSSPHKTGSIHTPWQDTFDADNGHIHYYGDNKLPGVDPEKSKGNKSLVQQFLIQNSPDVGIRRASVPLIFFRRVRTDGRAKGNVQFQGFGVVHKTMLVTQYDRNQGCSFANYSFDFTVFALTKEQECFSWEWISKRRNADFTLPETEEYAPVSWRKWIKEGPVAREKCRRHVSKLLTFSSREQKPTRGSVEQKVLDEVYAYYKNKKARFEALAAKIAGTVIEGSGGRFQQGWITPQSSDGGSDCVGRLDIGTDFSRATLIVLGQAKCEHPDSPTGGSHIARTVARLKRGWIGTYVTTSYFSEAVQREVIDDQYPLVLIHGLRVATEVRRLVHEGGYRSVHDLLREIDHGYSLKVAARRPEELLYE